MVACDVEQVKYEAELAELRTAVEGVLHELVVGKLTSAATRQARFVTDPHNLHVVLGKKITAYVVQQRSSCSRMCAY